MRKIILFRFVLPLSVFVFSQFLQAQKTLQNETFSIFQKVVPNAYESTAAGGSFLGPFSNSPRTYQMLIAASELTDLVGKNLTSLSFRSLTSATSAWPTSDVTFSSFDIYLSGSVNPANRSLAAFADNVVGVQTQVRSGSLLVPANALTSGGNPNAFSFDINFTNPWTYTGGNLLIEIRHTGFSGTSRSVEAVTTSTSGYATLFSACWQGNYTGTVNVTQGNFCTVNLKGNDNLASVGFDAAQYAVFPNPTADQLHIEGHYAINKISLFNLLGELILEKSSDTSSQTIDLSSLHNGSYLLRIESELGVSHQKIIKK